MKYVFIYAAIAALSFGCAHQQNNVATTSAAERNVAAIGGKKIVRVHTQSCQSAYTKGFKSTSVSDVSDAADVCIKAAESVCTAYVEKNSDGPGTGDGRYIAAMCELRAAYGANKAVNKGKASQNCEAAVSKAKNSPSSGDMDEATDTCTKEKSSACESKVNAESDGPQTGDGRWMAASCELTAAYGSYSEVRKIK